MKHLILTLLKIGLAGALVWFVISQIETRDRLQLPAASEAEASEPLYGKFLGDWRAAEWRFETEDGVLFQGPG
ncbi:MAG: hypothetical protein ACYSU1_02295, partial [Planctomycetota bacterium]